MAEAGCSTVEGSLTQEFVVPSHVQMVKGLMAEFAARHGSAGRRVVLVTSGGTKVPLESRTVRFLDNFSSGRRGASSAEYFLDAGYAVVFLHRHRSLYPYTRRYAGVNLLDGLRLEPATGECSPARVVADQESLPGIAAVLKRYQEVKAAGLLLPVEFNTLSEYLHLLKAAAQALSNMGSKAMFYLAAAVSDFYIPASEMPEHKIQSSDGPLQHEDGAQDAVSAGEGLGPKGVCHLLQAGDRPGYPAGAGASGTGHLPPPGRGGQRAGYAARLRGCGDTGPRDRAGPHGCRGAGRAGDRGEDRRQPGLSPQLLYCPAGVRRSYRAWTSPSRPNSTIRNGGLSKEPTHPAYLDKSKLVLGIGVKCVNTTCDGRACSVPPGETASRLLWQQSPVSLSGMRLYVVYCERVEQSLNHRSVARVLWWVCYKPNMSMIQQRCLMLKCKI
ncbi:phosphopantothenate--cysteine ligase isoform X1 [Brienomyrus brachyistius]|uniref:phosphopantothenate--cysteine ligase isoform X1 n=1 Tax=Brienomyrus brachyistius TaxID=42636 RepID=UPI0020B2BB97|nr:phosphopantothenate--cysteine ligase isoform X1 [Brienomyrus brachyistius]XP_048879234.1 phosphopantothenate--cysteine ligase isoform X1 [Brienomyrus brachyistius]